LLAIDLAHRNLPELLAPGPPLAECAADRGWTSQSLVSEWWQGTTAQFAGQPVEHSASLQIAGDTEEIEQRLWEAQVQVLLPFIERQRRLLVQRLNGLLQVPFVGRRGEVIDDVRDLELGHIEFQCCERPKAVDCHTRRLVTSLKLARNELAHFGTLGTWVLEDPVWRGFLG
jgi:hypothetical protein